MGRSVGARLRDQHVNRGPRRRRQATEVLGAMAWLLAALIKKTLVVALISVILLGGWAMASTSKAFAVRRAVVEGNAHLSSLDVLRAAGVGAHSNLLALNVERIAQRVAQLPWINDVGVTRRPPHTVRIRIEERRPHLLALAGGHIYCLDQNMRPFAALDGQKPIDLPVLTGLNKADILEPDADVEKLTAAAREMLRMLPAEGLPGRKRLSEINIDRIWGLSLVFDGFTPTVRLGFDNFGPKLRRLVGVGADLERRGELERATLIDLDHNHRVVVRLAREAA